MLDLQNDIKFILLRRFVTAVELKSCVNCVCLV